MIAYKGFGPGLICRGYRFQMGKNVTEQANCAENGFHCAENPLDCLYYYSDMKQFEYYLVDAGGDVDEDPVACGRKGDLLAYAKEDPVVGKITQVALLAVDGKKVLPHRWYDIDAVERKV